MMRKMASQSRQQCSDDSRNPSTLSSLESANEDFSATEIEPDEDFIDAPREPNSPLWHGCEDERDHPADSIATAPRACPQPSTLSIAIESSSQLLNQLVDQFASLNDLVTSQAPSGFNGAGQAESEAEVFALRHQIAELKQQLSDVQHQNEEMASQLAIGNERKPEPNAQSSKLSWEDRKGEILSQMEQDSFDAEAFITALQTDLDDSPDDPIAHVQQLHVELQRREEEIKELQCCLQQEKQAKVAVGAIPNLVDADELVRKERETLRQLRAEWEEEFRAGEIAASLERAKLSRERRQLSQMNEELQEQLSHLRRQAEEDRKAGVTGARRWLAKLGLDDGKS